MSAKWKCPRCGEPLERGRCQANGEVWCFECSLYPHDVEVREQKANGTFVAPRVPFRITFRPMHAWTAPEKEPTKA